MDEYEPRVWLALLPDHRHELPAAVESAILYEVDLFMTTLTVHVDAPLLARRLIHFYPDGQRVG
jgi:hypothetical protein